MTDIIVKMQFGSHVYGTNLPTSDLDFKAIHLPAPRDILLQRVKNAVHVTTKADSTARNTKDDIDFESFSLQKFMALLLEGQTVPLTMLFTPDQWIIEETPLWDEMKKHREKWLHRGVCAFAGYCRQQANKYGIRGSRVAASRAAVGFFKRLIDEHGHQAKIKHHWTAVEALAASGTEHISIVTGLHAEGKSVRMLEICNRKVQEHATLKEGYAMSKRIFDEYGHRALMAETNQGVDWKAMMHATRVCREAEELLLHHSITYPRPEAELLLAIRKGEIPYKDAADILEQGLLRLEECQRISTLPDAPDYAFADELVERAYRETILGMAA